MAFLTIPVAKLLNFLAVLDKVFCGCCGDGCFGKCCRGCGNFFAIILMFLITANLGHMLARSFKKIGCVDIRYCLHGDQRREFGVVYGISVGTNILVAKPLVLFIKVLIFRIFFRSDNGSCKYKMIRAGYARDYMVAAFAVLYKGRGMSI